MSKHYISFIVLALLVTLLSTGCQAPGINWDKRIGTFTYDQAVEELGPPDSQAVLSDGRTVVKWSSHYYVEGGAFIVGGFHSRLVETYPGSYQESSLILTFNPNHVLVFWARR